MLPLGTPAPRFALSDTVSGRRVALEDFASSPALLIAFVCNHCPFVKHILDEFVVFARDFGPRGLAVVAISSNDVDSYPDDAPVEMTRIATLKRFTFPYLYDESQQVAKAYQAICTPDFFLFDRNRRLAYRGQFDGSRPEQYSGHRFGSAHSSRGTAARKPVPRSRHERGMQRQMEIRPGAGLDIEGPARAQYRPGPFSAHGFGRPSPGEQPAEGRDASGNRRLVLQRVAETRVIGLFGHGEEGRPGT